MSTTDAPEPVAEAAPETARKPAPPQTRGGAERAELAASVEVVVFSSERPMTAAKINEIAEVGGVRNVRRAVDDLNAAYEAAGRAFRIVEIAGGYQFQTLGEYGDVLSRLRKSRSESRLTQAALETLAIVAYRQPALRADVEAIRGVACGEVLRGLMDKDLLRIAGRAEEIGRPILYATTRHFLEVFGLASIEDLPNAEQLRMPLGQEQQSDAPAEEADDGEQQPDGQAPHAPEPHDDHEPDDDEEEEEEEELVDDED